MSEKRKRKPNNGERWKKRGDEKISRGYTKSPARRQWEKESEGETQ